MTLGKGGDPQSEVVSPKQRGPAAKDEVLYDRLLADIASGRFTGGQRLKTNELAKIYGSSTTPIREALRQLQGEGFVEITQNRGATVLDIDTNALRDIYEVLELLEPYFCSWFAEFHTPEQIVELEAVQRQIESLQPRDNAKPHYSELDDRFHRVIYLGHYNKRALTLWENLRRGLNIFTAGLPLSTSRLRESCKEHQALIGAIRSGDAAAARDAQRVHIASAGEFMYKQLRGRQAI